MPMTPHPRATAKPHNKSERARAAETRGERTWTGWRLAELVDQILRLNRKGVSEREVRSVKPLEYLKVKVLEPSECHHTGLRMPDPLGGKQDQYFRVRRKVAENLTSQELALWRAKGLSDEELDEAVFNLTGRSYYRQRRQ